MLLFEQMLRLFGESVNNPTFSLKLEKRGLPCFIKGNNYIVYMILKVKLSLNFCGMPQFFLNPSNIMNFHQSILEHTPYLNFYYSNEIV